MYIWRDNSVRSHGSREAGESQALRGIIQFRDFPVQRSRRPRVSKDRGLLSPAIHVLAAEIYRLSSPYFSPLSPFSFALLFIFLSSLHAWLTKSVWAGEVVRRCGPGLRSVPLGCSVWPLSHTLLSLSCFLAGICPC